MEKYKHLIFLENHTKPAKITEIVKDRLDLEEKLAVLTDNRPYSLLHKSLLDYASRLKKGANPYDTFIKINGKPQDFFVYCFERQLELIDFAHLSKVEFKVIPLDIRSSPKYYKQFKKQDKEFPKLIKKAPKKLDNRAIEFFEEHALDAWHTNKKITQLKKQGFKSFVYSTGYSHFASLAHYLRNKDLLFVYLQHKDFDTYYKRMCSFFLPEYRNKYCLKSGKEN